MIVIMIIGVVYTLAVTKLKSYGEEKVTPSLANLKEYLESFTKEEEAQRVKLLCLDDCDTCSIYVDEVEIATLEGFLDESVRVYRYDFLQGAVEKKEDVFFNDEDVQERVCFSFEVDKYGISEQLLVVYKEKAYDYTTYFEPTALYDSLEDLLEKKENDIQEVMR